MAHDEHHTPGEPPPVRDDAADSPLWLPAVGLAILLLGAILLVWRGTSDDSGYFDLEEASEEDGAAADGDAADGDAADDPAAEGGDEAEADHP